jgi:hypothetical protein
VDRIQPDGADRLEDNGREDSEDEVKTMLQNTYCIIMLTSKQDENRILTRDVDSHGKLYAKSPVADYVERGEALSEYNMLEFFVDTYEECLSSQTDVAEEDTTDEKNNEDEEEPKAGRTSNTCILYKENHPRSHQKQHIIC